MERSLDLLDEIRDVVEAEAGPQGPEVTNRHPEGRARRGGEPGKTASQRVVDHLAEGQARPPRQRLQPRRHVLIEGERRAHVMMLKREHHDVNVRDPPASEDRQDI